MRELRHYLQAYTAGGRTDGAWNYQLLHAFTIDPIQGYSEDGIDPNTPLVNFNNVFYGTTHGGGDSQCGCGAVFSITPDGTYTILHVFDPFVPGRRAGSVAAGHDPGRRTSDQLEWNDLRHHELRRHRPTGPR